MSTPDPVVVVRWKVFNASGQLVATYDNEAAAKAHCTCWASGMYYVGG